MGDTINYTIVVHNKGNVTLRDISLTDILTDGNGNLLSLNSGPTFVSATNGSNQNLLLVGGTSTFTAVAGKGYFVNTTGGAITVNLPAGSAGAQVALADYAGTWDDNNCI